METNSRAFVFAILMGLVSAFVACERPRNERPAATREGQSARAAGEIGDPAELAKWYSGRGESVNHLWLSRPDRRFVAVAASLPPGPNHGRTTRVDLWQLPATSPIANSESAEGGWIDAGELVTFPGHDAPTLVAVVSDEDQSNVALFDLAQRRLETSPVGPPQPQLVFAGLSMYWLANRPCLFAADWADGNTGKTVQRSWLVPETHGMRSVSNDHSCQGAEVVRLKRAN